MLDRVEGVCRQLTSDPARQSSLRELVLGSPCPESVLVGFEERLALVQRIRPRRGQQLMRAELGRAPFRRSLRGWQRFAIDLGTLFWDDPTTPTAGELAGWIE